MSETELSILGWDFMVANGIVLDTRNMSLDVIGKAVPLVTPRQSVPFLTGVSVTSTVTIPAMSKSVIPATLDAPLKGPNGSLYRTL